ncbi:GNAT family acetyltransferase [Priestia megaterium]|jgi:predicted N-acetyltransferase YhbS|nr:GNAT family acetyltransferase [Priestia megaterium]MCR8929037.1 GNAT family acetyltransferase [Priestia megaterium]
MDIFITQELTEEYNKTEEVVKSSFLNEEYSDKKEHFDVPEEFFMTLELTQGLSKNMQGVVQYSKAFSE